MANEENIIPYRFKKGQSGNPKGRPKNRVPENLVKILGKRQAKKFYSLSAMEIDDWESTILTLTAAELSTLAKMEESPAYPKGLAVAVLMDMKNGKTTTIDKLRERQFGKAVQKVELTGRDGESLLPKQITPQEAKALIKTLEEEF